MDDDELTLTGYRFLARCALLSVLAGFLIDGLMHLARVHYWLTRVYSGEVQAAHLGTSLTPYALWAGLGFTVIAMGATTRRMARYSVWPFCLLAPPSILAFARHVSLEIYSSDYQRYVTPAGERLLTAFTAMLVAAPALALANHVLFTLEATAALRQAPLPAAQVTSRAARLRSRRSPTDHPASPSD